MTYRVRIDPLAQREIDQFALYLRAYSEEFAIEQIERLDRILPLISQNRRSPGLISRSRARRIAATCSAWGAAPNTGSFTRLMKKPAPSTSFRSGTRRATRTHSVSEQCRSVAGGAFIHTRRTGNYPVFAKSGVRRCWKACTPSRAAAVQALSPNAR